MKQCKENNYKRHGYILKAGVPEGGPVFPNLDTVCAPIHAYIHLRWVTFDFFLVMNCWKPFFVRSIKIIGQSVLVLSNDAFQMYNIYVATCDCMPWRWTENDTVVDCFRALSRHSLKGTWGKTLQHWNPLWPYEHELTIISSHSQQSSETLCWHAQ